MGEAPAEEESENEPKVEPDSDASSDDQMFGFGFAQAQKQQTKKGGAKKGGPKDAAEKNTSGGKVGRNNKDADGLDAKVSKVASQQELLEQITPMALWQGSIKEKDVDTKLKKALELSQTIQDHPNSTTQQLSKAKGLESTALQVTDTLSMMNSLKQIFEEQFNSRDGATFEGTFLVLEDSLVSKFAAFPHDCQNAMLTHAGRQLTEAPNGRQIRNPHQSGSVCL